MIWSNISELDLNEKLNKLVLTKEIQESAHSIMSCYIHGEDNIPGISDKVYAMGKAIDKKMGIDTNEMKKHTSKRLKAGTERKES